MSYLINKLGNANIEPTGVLFVQTASATVANTTSETTLTSTGEGSLTLPANFFIVARTLRISAMGYHSTTAAPTLNMKVKLGSTVIVSTGAHTMHNDSNKLWAVNAIITCRSVGGSGTVFGQGEFMDYGTADGPIQMVNTTTTTIATTSSQAITITATWGTASASNTITCTNLVVEAIL